MSTRFPIFPLLMAVASGIAAPVADAPAMTPASRPSDSGLVWDATEKQVQGKPGEWKVDFEFVATNPTPAPVQIRGVFPSCGCTVMKLPALPFTLAPGDRQVFAGTIDYGGKHGRLSKGIRVETSSGGQTLRISVEIPAMDAVAREQNQMLARADRQKVFSGDCAACHASPAAGKRGAALYAAICAVCHESPNRAAMVPSLKNQPAAYDAAYWREWISRGREQTLMPAFADTQGGPLSTEQVESLVGFLLHESSPPKSEK